MPGKPVRTVRVLCQHIRTSPPDTCRAPIVVQGLGRWSGRGQQSRGLRSAKPQGRRLPAGQQEGRRPYRPGAHRAPGRPVSSAGQNGGTTRPTSRGGARRWPRRTQGRSGRSRPRRPSPPAWWSRRTRPGAGDGLGGAGEVHGVPSFALVPGGGAWVVVCSGAGRHAGVIGREGNRPAPGGQDVFQRAKKGTVPAQPAGLPASRKKILAARGERSERPVALPTAPARLNKPEYATGPAAGDAPGGTEGMDLTSGPGSPDAPVPPGEPCPPGDLPAATTQGPAWFRR